MKYEFYVEVRGITESTVVDMRDYGWSRTSWTSLSAGDQDEVLAEVFRELMSDLCDSGWYLVKD